MSNIKEMQQLHKTQKREDLPEAYQAYRDLELSKLTEQVLRMAGGRNVNPEYLKEFAAALSNEANKREQS